MNTSKVSHRDGIGDFTSVPTSDVDLLQEKDMISRHIEVLVEYGEGELVLNNNFRAGSKLLGGDSDETRMNNFELYSNTLHLPTHLQRHDIF